ncbi:MAG: hypothetical protein IPJ27_20920 [Candidatus Accumulibacter sp.]|uniref:Carbamoyltransferase n=1 Tax=Candidatus Accumulibacter proximus TaxID=2954385 RepID=A0A935Q115_9PROT|nr:hypothetical protein [Candidatus Accumulibacter proximus]
MLILGISAFYHDSAAALLRDGEIVAAAQEERFTRKKHDPGFPGNALEYCLGAAGIGWQDVDHVAFYDKPFLKFERLLETYVSFAPRGFESFRMAIPVWLREKLFLKDLLVKELRRYAPDPDWESRLRFSEHHLSHAASAFFPSPFEEAAVLTMDGVGEWATTSLAIGRGNKLEVLKEIQFPHSLGLLYSAFTYYTGFKVNSGEYKLMGLAPYGEPRYVREIFDHLVDLKADGSFRLDQSYFNYCTGLTMTGPKFNELFGGPPRAANEPLTQHHMDLAASVQAATEQIVLQLARSIRAETGMRNLCLAGGVALNCVANGKVLRDGQFDDIWVQPAAGDAGGALGAALAVHHIHLGRPRSADGSDRMRGSYLGPEFAQADIELDVADWFELDGDSPYMLLVADVVERRRRPMTEAEQKLFGIEKLNVPRSDIPAVTHVDYSARIQTVHAETNPRYHALISAFKRQTGCPVIVNTSFNVRGEPIVCTPEDAFRCFMGTEIEALAVGNCFLKKEDQDPALKLNYETAFELD